MLVVCDTIYASSSKQGVYYSTNNGERWELCSSNLFTDKILSLEIDKNGHIFVGTSCHGVFTTGKVASVSDIIINNEFYLHDNYPNPFNSRTVITFSTSGRNYVTLEIYDLLGRKISALIDEEKATGKYSVIFNAENLASGIYYYRLRCDGCYKTKKMLLLK